MCTRPLRRAPWPDGWCRHVEANLGDALGGEGLLQRSEHRSPIPFTPSSRLHEDLVEVHAVWWHSCVCRRTPQPTPRRAVRVESCPAAMTLALGFGMFAP